MTSQPPDSGSAEHTGSALPAESAGTGAWSSSAGQEASGSRSGSSQTHSRRTDSQVVIVPGVGTGAAEVHPDDRTVISAAKSSAPLPEIPLDVGTKQAAQYLGQTLIGRRLEHYQLEEFVGGGGMGAVFRATDMRLGRTVAVKVLSRDQSSEENVRRFRNEAQSAARLDHRNIARVHYVGEDAGLNFIVFEFIEGINLRDVVQQKGPLELEEALRYTVQVAEALAHASQRDVVHRDIKPSNVLIMPSGQVKLVDMGLARLHQVDSSFDDLTASGVTLGTFDYISPEQARDPRAADVRSDIYSLGCTLYFTLTGKPPFPDGSALQKLLRHNGVDPPDVRLFRPDLPVSVGPLLAKMLAKRPLQRPQSAEELILDLERVARDAGLELGSRGDDVSLPTAKVSPAWANWALSIVAPVVVLAVALFILELVTRQPANETRLQLQPAPLAVPANESQTNKKEAAANDTSTEPKSPGEPKSTANGINGDAAIQSATDVPGSGKPNTDPAPSELIENPPPVSPLKVGSPPDVNATRTAPMPPMPEIALPPPKPPAPKIIVRRGMQPAASPTEAEVVGSLSQAVRRAGEKGIGEIEVDIHGVFEDYAFEVPPGRLNIHPAPGRKPVILFRPEVATADDSRHMIHLLGGTSRLSLNDLEFRLELPSDPSSGWSLITMHQGQSLDLTNCVITVVDKGPTGLPVHDQVSIVHLQTRRLTETMKMEDEMAMVTAAAINLSSCFVRGEATFLDMPEELPVKLVWNEGLFVSSKRLIETGGTVSKPRSFSRIELALDHVTVAAQQGVFLMERKRDAAYQLDLNVNSSRSIFSVSGTTPLFEFAGMGTVEEVHFTFEGADNCYPREEMNFLRARPVGEGTNDYSLANRSQWSANERSPDLGVIWQSPPDARLPVHAQLPEHYQLSPTSPHAVGFSANDLPRPADSQTKTLKPVPESASEAPAEVVPPKPANPAATSSPPPPAEPDPPSE
jgi:serine/threonine protein kinase